MHLRRMPATVTVLAVETVSQSPSACWIAGRDTVDRALMTTLSGSENGAICGSGVEARAVSQSAGGQKSASQPDAAGEAVAGGEAADVAGPAPLALSLARPGRARASVRGALTAS